MILEKRVVAMDYNRQDSLNYQKEHGMDNLRSQNGSYPPEFTTPPPIDFSSEEMRGSIQKILSENVGESVVVEFLIGTQQIMRKQGILYFVGTSYVTLYDDRSNNFIVCDLFSIKFVYFYFPGQRPSQNYNLLPGGNGANRNRG